jgi:flagellar hook-associated protein 2
MKAESATISLSGIYSDIDTDSLVTAALATQTARVTALEEQVTTEESEETALEDIASSLGDIQDLMEEMKDASNLSTVSATSSDSGIVAVETETGATVGTHTVVVNQLATSQIRIQTTGLDSEDSLVGASAATAGNSNTVSDADADWITVGATDAVFSFQVGDETAISSVTLSANTTYSMNEIVSAINAQSQSQADYDAASVVETQGAYSLQLVSKQSGDVGDLTVTQSSGDSITELTSDAWSTTAGTAGAFSYTYGEVTRTLQTATDTTLSDLVNLINDDSSNPGVTASVLEYDGTYHLVLSANDTGAGNTITINDSATTLAGFDSADIAETQSSQDAQIRVDGFPSSDWITRSSNTVSDVISNLTLTLETTGTVNISMSRSNSSVETYLESLVSAYNSLNDMMEEYTGYDADTETAGVLQGKSSVSDPFDQIRSSLISLMDGFSSDDDTYTVGSQLGLSFDDDGVLSLDTDTLDDALDADYEAVIAWIAADGTGTSDSDYIQFDSATGSTTAGSYDVKVTYDANGNITQATAKLSTSDIWCNLTIDGNKLSGKSGSDAEGLTLTVASDGTAGAHTQTAQVRVQRGFAASNYNYLETALDDTNGIYAVLEDEVQTTIDNLNDKIDTLNDRIETKKAILEAKYARMEAKLAELEQQSEAVNSLSTTNDINKSNSE